MSCSEDWRPIPGFPGYSASRTGLIMGRKGRVMSNKKLDTDGYPCVSLWVGDRYRCKCIHQVVALAWLGPKPSPRHEVAHRDGDRRNSAVANLRWATRKENMADMRGHGTIRCGERHHAAKLTEADVVAIRQRLVGGESRRNLASAYGVDYFAIAKIATGRRWKHLPLMPAASS